MRSNDDTDASRRTVLKTAAAAIAGTGALTAATGSAAAASKSEQIGDAPYGAVEDARYATMGVDDDAPTATLYGNFKCPYTQNFVLDHLAALARDYVRTGRLNLRFRSLAYEPNPDNPSHGISPEYISEDDPDIARTGLGVWNEEPENYWQYFLDMFQNQPSGGYDNDDLEALMERYDVRNWGLIGNYVANDRYEDALRETQDDAADVGVTATPTLVMEGETTYPHHGEYNGDLYDWINAQLDD